VGQPGSSGDGSRASRDRRSDQLQPHARPPAAHGDAGWHAHAFPLSVDGVEIVASLVLLADRRTGRRSGWLPWTALTIGTAASLAANIATAQSGTVSRIIAGWPALALLIAVKLLSGILEHRPAGDCPAAAIPDPAASADRDDSRDQNRPRPARAARDELRLHGQPLNRDALAARLRQAGHQVRNARLTPLPAR
jgi:Protein of unknown function (DUF2637)